jgi:predicted Zn-dependent protease
MKRLFFTLVTFLTLISCATVPITGRQQLSLVSQDSLNAMSFESYDEFLSQHRIIKNTAQAHMVEQVGKNIQRAVEQYFAENNLSAHLKGYEWEFNLVDENTVNAWCMPGGKVVIYTGILPVTKDEPGLAVVMGHEIAQNLNKLKIYFQLYMV